GMLSREGLVKDRPQGKQIAGGKIFSADPLRSQIGQGGSRQSCRGIETSGQSEVEQLDLAFSGYQNIFRRKIAMRDGLRLQGLQGLEAVLQPMEDLTGRNRLRGLQQAPALDVLHPKTGAARIAEQRRAVGGVTEDPRNRRMS